MHAHIHWPKVLAVTASLLCGTTLQAQRVNIKTNALYWATATPNFGVEFRLNRHLTLNLEAAANRLKVKQYDTKALAFTPEMRYWFSARPQTGHFVGIMGMGTHYDLKLDKTRHNGDAFGAGITYGYSFVLGRHWSLETTLGLGALHVREGKTKDGETENYHRKGPNNTKWVATPLKAGVTFVYIIK